jgi:hypothetical protein
MTYDQDRDTRAPADLHPNQRPYSRRGAGLSVAFMLVLMAAFVAVGIWLRTTDPAAVTDDRPIQERSSTGAGSHEPPLPATPTAPTVPSQPRQ